MNITITISQDAVTALQVIEGASDIQKYFQDVTDFEMSNLIKSYQHKLQDDSASALQALFQNYGNLPPSSQTQIQSILATATPVQVSASPSPVQSSPQ